jgi:hypothetical protein
MNQPSSVPRLDLAPKLKRPLSLWNPLDYLRLLCWVFYFPQAFRWYVDTFGGGYIPPKEMNWRKGWEILRQNPIQRQLLIQGLVLTVVLPVASALILQEIGVLIDWWDFVWGVAWGMVSGVGLSVVFGVAFGVGWSVAIGVTLIAVSNLALGVVPGVATGVAFGVASSVASGVAWRVIPVVALGVALGVASGAALGIASSVAWSVAILRPDIWLIAIPLNLSLHQNSWRFPRVTLLPLPLLAFRLQKWLQQDWETGLHNTNQLLAYTLQFVPVVQAVNKVLAETQKEQIILRVSQLAEAPFDWQIVYFASASLDEGLKSKVLESLVSFVSYFPDSWQKSPSNSTNTCLETPSRAVAAGFWHMRKKEPEQAKEAFAEVRDLIYGEEMFILAQTLAAFHNTKELATIANLQLSAFPAEPLLRPTTWQNLRCLRRVVEDTQIFQRSVSHFNRSLTLNRAQGELQSLVDNAETLPQAERDLILDIAQTWQKALLQIAGVVGEISITKRVTNPYIIGDPVEGNLFVGREDVMRQLAELWVRENHLQSVVIYGHRRMGKTSILLNAAKLIGEGVKVAYINFLNIGDSPQGVGEVLMAICDAISDEVNLPPPTDADLINLPYPTFRRYLKQVAASLIGGLIIALDEFEKIEDLIEAGKIPIDFMEYLRGQLQMSSKIAFAFAGLHTLEEMTADYFKPFFASVICIRVGFMKPGAARQILANPDQEFPLDYLPEVLDKIHTLTAGQPYLVQLVGFLLVRHYNDTVFEQGRPRNPVFTIDDLDAVINNPELFQKGSGYFYGVWGQAARGAQGQQMILKTLAPHPEGLSLAELKAQLSQFLGATTGGLPLPMKTLNEALETLKRHDVIAEKDGRWLIVVELFRRWVIER